jgi:hypothetical protein
MQAFLGPLPNNFTNVTKSDAIAAGGMFVMNQVRSAVDAYIEDALTVEAGGSVAVTALETATIVAIIDSAVTSDGGSVVGGGDSIAINGTVATNAVLSKANARIVRSDITATGGDVTVNAENASNIDALVDSSVVSAGTSIGVTLAFNTIGVLPQNFLFNTIDALIGTDIADQAPAETRAWIEDSVVDAGGAISVTTVSDASINAQVLSAARAIKVNASSGGGGGDGGGGTGGGGGDTGWWHGHRSQVRQEQWRYQAGQGYRRWR